MAVRKMYGVRVYKDGNPCAEFTYYSLDEIYKKTIQYENPKDLSNEMKKKFKEKYPEFFDPSSFYSAKIVYYPNKAETKKIAKESEYGKFKSNGISSEYIPILYKKDSKIFDQNYIRKRFYSLLSSQDPSFRNRLERFYNTSVIPNIDKDGNKVLKSSINIYRDVLGIIKAYKSGIAEELYYSIGKLYDKIIEGSPRERTKIYTIMETEFPLRKKETKEQRPVQTEMDFRKEVPWIDYFKLSEEERKNYRQGPMQKGDALRLLKLVTSQQNKQR